ncbi:Zn(II)2Cys6 transcription factor [Sporobolomyces koalae]|uniref:Zn(II)2Cys6 transcription factor n=1 Tax=Sporobolomyces koalae TaxID=500713 RepID=UPI003176D1E5
MPADRSSFSPFPAGAQSSKDKHSVARGLACLACRKRKVKCDSGKPACGGCIKAAKGDVASVSCEYDDVNLPKKKRSSPGTVAALEASNQALQAELDELKRYISQSRSNPLDLPRPPAHQTFPTPFGPSPSHEFDPIALSGQLNVSTSTAHNSPGTTSPDPICEISRRDPRGSSYSASLVLGGEASSNGVAFDSSEPTTPAGDYWTQLIYPGWPKDLPSFDLTSRLIDVWFTKPHSLTGLINEERFRASMLHPPTTAGFPHSALIHSMLALAAMLVSDDFFANEPRYWPLDQKVTEYHAARGKVALDQAIAHGQRLLQVSQAVSILCYWAYISARFVELWLLCGMATRIMTPIGLNQLAAPQDPNRYKMHLLPPPKDDDELYERSINCWYAFMSDRMATACTGWAHSIDEADIVSLLPTDAPSSLAGDFESSPLSPRSPSFFLAHPPHLVGPLQLELKAIILLGRVNTFVQRAPMAYRQRDYNSLNSSTPDIRKSDAFRKLENDIVGFQASIPREYQTHSATTANPRLFAIHSLPSASMLLLHERFITTEPQDPSGPISLRFAQQVMQVLHSIVSTSFEIGYLSPFMNYVWVVAGRNLVREIAFRLIRNQVEGVEQLRGDVQTILLALHACKTPLAISTATQLQTLLDDPFRALPVSSAYSNCVLTVAERNFFSTYKCDGWNNRNEVFDATSSYPTLSPELVSGATPSTSSSASSYKPFTPPLSTPSSHSNLTGLNEVVSQQTFQQIDETLKNGGFFGSLGENSFGPELDALIHGSRSNAPWVAGNNSVNLATAQVLKPNESSVRNEGQYATTGIASDVQRFVELDSRELMSMGSFFGTGTN